MTARRSRLNAEKQAKELSEIISDDQVVEILRQWRFSRNRKRANVMMNDEQFVHSDTLGLVRSRDGRIVPTKATRKYPSTVRLLCRWVTDNQPDVKMPFCYT